MVVEGERVDELVFCSLLPAALMLHDDDCPSNGIVVRSELEADLERMTG